MKTIKIKATIVRIYITESSNLLEKILTYLQKEAKVRGVTVFRAINGYGETGTHTSFLLDISLDLPIVVEFFDEKKIVKPVLKYLSTIVKPKHIISWDGIINKLENHD